MNDVTNIIDSHELSQEIKETQSHKTYVMKATTQSFQLSKILVKYNIVKQSEEIIKDQLYKVMLTEDEFNKINRNFSSLVYTIGNLLNGRKTVKERYLGYDNANFFETRSEDSFKITRDEYKDEQIKNMNAGLKMTVYDVVVDVTQHLKVLLPDVEESDLVNYVVSVASQCKKPFKNVYFASHEPTLITLDDNKENADLKFYMDINKFIKDRRYNFLDEFFNDRNAYSVISKNALKNSGIEKFNMPVLDTYLENYYDNEDVCTKIEESMPTYNGQSFYGFTYKPFEFFCFYRIAEDYTSLEETIANCVIRQISGYYAIHALNDFFEYMENVNQRLDKGEKIESSEVIEWLKNYS